MDYMESGWSRKEWAGRTPEKRGWVVRMHVSWKRFSGVADHLA